MVEVLTESSEQSVEANADAAGRAAKCTCNLGRIEVGAEPERDQRSIVDRQSRERACEVDAGRDGGLVGGPAGAGDALVRGDLAQRTAPGTTDDLPRLVGRDLEEPRAEACVLAMRAELPPGDRPRGLHGVLRAGGIAKDREGDTGHVG